MPKACRPGAQSAAWTRLPFIRPKGLATLRIRGAAPPLGSAIAQRAANDPAIYEALNLRGDFGWPQIYDIIEFLGGPSEIERAGWAAKNRTRCIRQTANHFR